MRTFAGGVGFAEGEGQGFSFTPSISWKWSDCGRRHTAGHASLEFREGIQAEGKCGDLKP